jgi:hypothetical protein
VTVRTPSRHVAFARSQSKPGPRGTDREKEPYLLS